MLLEAEGPPGRAAGLELNLPTFLYSELGRAGFLPPGSGSVSSSRFLVFLLLLQGEQLNHLRPFGGLTLTFVSLWRGRSVRVGPERGESPMGPNGTAMWTEPVRLD